MAIYQMMFGDLRPAAIVEIGSTYTSLSWLRDMSNLFGLSATIIGMDQYKPDVLPDGVQFVQGDVSAIQELLPHDLLASLPRPLLIIEDAHAQVPDVLRHLGQAMLPGDYLVVEDSLLKQTAILKWAEETPDLFFVDLHYTDFFGINATTAVNSILTKSGFI